MYKPTILPYWHTNPYQEQTRQVGIYNDTLNIDSSDVKILIQREPPQVLNIVDAIIKNQDRYDLILAWNEDVLNNFTAMTGAEQNNATRSVRLEFSYEV